MPATRSTTLYNAARLLACLLILKVTASVVLAYHDYLPPNFDSGFLQGRQSYFYSGYQWPFYLHIFVGPLTLVVGLVLMSQRFRRRFTHWHRRLGKLQIATVLLGVAPSGIWMAFYAQTGAIAGAGFTALGAVTAATALLGWRSAVNRRFDEHQRWMTRCYLLLCSAVVLRLIGGLFTVAGFASPWTYTFAAWASWLAPLLAYELLRAVRPKSTPIAPHPSQPAVGSAIR